MPDDLDYGDNGLPPEAVALLETISNTESAGSYNVIYSGAKANNFDDHPRVWVEIQSGPNKGKYSSAAGKYQFIAPTWDKAKRALDLKDFSPASQDKAAWWLAQEDYRRSTGRDLLRDLQEGGDANMRRVGKTLAKTWTSLPSGIEQGQTHDRFTNSYNRALGGRMGFPVSAPPAGIAGDAGQAPVPLPRRLAKPAPLSFDPAPTANVSASSATGIGVRRDASGSIVAPPDAQPAQKRSSTVSAPASLVAAAQPAPRAAVRGQNLTVQQIGQQADNARLSGYRDIQEMGPSSKGSPSPPQPPAPTGLVRTANAQAANIAMPPGARPSSVPPPPVESPVPKYIVTSTKVPIKPTPPTPEATAKLMDIHDRREAAQMAAQTKRDPANPPPLEFKTVTKKVLNPEWVELERSKKPPIAAPVPLSRPPGLGGPAPAGAGGSGGASAMGIGIGIGAPAGGTIRGSSTGVERNVGQRFVSGGYVFRATPGGFVNEGRASTSKSSSSGDRFTPAQSLV